MTDHLVARMRPFERTIFGEMSALATSLGIELIAEGVETRHQRDRLLELGCLYAQGFLFSPPVPLPGG